MRTTAMAIQALAPEDEPEWEEDEAEGVEVEELAAESVSVRLVRRCGRMMFERKWENFRSSLY